MNPKIFISHASEDKERFVINFANKLRASGVDAWVDLWEMLPGDSLMDKVFEEGIKDASGVIVVLSKFSITKPWVREELNAALVKKIDSGSKLIPVVLDDCEVPMALRSTVWEKISDLDSFDLNLKRVVSSIFNVTEKPPLGAPPDYVKSFMKTIGGLSNIDSLVLRLSCEQALRIGHEHVNSNDIFSKEEVSSVPQEDLDDALEMLDKAGYIKITRLIGAKSCPYRVTAPGFQIFAEACLPDYQARVVSVISAIVNQQLFDNEQICSRLQENQMMVDHILAMLSGDGHFQLAELIGGFTRIWDVSPSLKRLLAEG